MNKISVVLLACVATYFCGCQKEKANISIKEPVKLSKQFLDHGVNPTELMTGEMDEFHPNSEVESRRKERLSTLGRLKNHPDIILSETVTPEKALNSPDFKSMRFTIDVSYYIKPFTYPFDYESDIDALDRLHKTHGLDKLINKKMNELETLTALMVYTYDYFEGGEAPSDDIRWEMGPSADSIAQFRKKGFGGTSEHYAALFCQLSLSCGFNSRLVGMHMIDENGEIKTHTVCDVYFDYMGKWVVFDPYSKATYYLRDDVPMSALELRDIMLDGQYRLITPVSEVGDFIDVVSVREELLPYYQYLYIWRMNNMLGKRNNGESVSWRQLYYSHLVWEDEKAPISKGKFDQLDKFNNTDSKEYPLNGVRFVARDIDDFYWKLNQSVINYKRVSDEVVDVYLDTITPNFKYFLVSAGSHDTSTRLSEHVVRVNKIPIQLYITTINQFGRPGKQVAITLGSL